MNRNVLSLVAVALVALFVGGMVSAVNVDASAFVLTKEKIENKGKMVDKSSLLVKDFADSRGMLVSKVKQSLIDSDDARNAREKNQVVDLTNDMRYPPKKSENGLAFAAEKVKASIVKDKKSNEGNASFQGWSINRIVNASGLTDEEKKIILASHSQLQEGQRNWKRYHILMWNADEKFMAIGKLAGIRENSTMSAYMRGFNSRDDKRFYMYASNGLLAGVQNGKVFWGTYDNGVGVMNFQNEDSMKFQYLVYSR